MSDPGVRYPPIEGYALLGDCHSTALVAQDGSIDWACLRRFDAASVFGRLLDWTRGGQFRIAAHDVVTRRRAYLDRTLVLASTTTSSTGTATVTDALTMRPGGQRDPNHELVRVIQGVDGTVTFDVEIAPRFDYGMTQPMLRRHDERTWSAIGGSEALLVTSDVPLCIDDARGGLFATVTVTAGEVARVALASSPAHALDPSSGDLDGIVARLEQTVTWWRDWCGEAGGTSAWADALIRSGIVLKALTCAPTGAVVAAATTSLPERVGGSLNWDYRYSWVRDSSLVIDALSGLGHPEVASGFRDFLLRSAAGRADDLQIMYGCYGERRLTEVELGLDGWRGTKPVRIGNQAADQTQLDVYGHLLDAVHAWHAQGEPLEDHERRFLRDAVDLAARRWREPDHGIWELRGARRDYVHSKAMCWVALDRGVRLAAVLEAEDRQVDDWREAAHDVRQAVLTHGVDPSTGNLVQHFATREVDASLLKAILVGFVEPDSHVARATLEAVRRDLADPPDGFVRRFRTAPGEEEGTFLICSFWLVEVLVLLGHTDEAQALFERLLGVANDVGLYSEEYDVATGAMLGNFPQAFTHLGLLTAAARLAAPAPPAP